jgi:hypothetical protein
MRAAALIALGAVVRVSRNERDGYARRGPASHCHGHKKNQKILHRPQPAVPRRRSVRHKPPSSDRVNPLFRAIGRNAMCARSHSHARWSNGYWPIH